MPRLLGLQYVPSITGWWYVVLQLHTTVISEGFHAYMAPERANLNDWFEGDKLIILCFTIPAEVRQLGASGGLMLMMLKNTNI